MVKLERYSEPYTPTGGLAAAGVLNQLGRPDTEPLEVLVREAIQNCWDARRPDSLGIEVSIGRSILDKNSVDFLNAHVLTDAPPSLGLDEQLRPGMRTLHFADFGTSGLGGPTRADLQGHPRDFVDFVRNIGQPPDKEFGGGSFGYGKAAFYLASAAHTVIVDTLCETSDGRYERRLLGCALGQTFEVAGKPFTGRHWWGRLVDGVPEPVTGTDADELAKALGLPVREGPGGRGTTVLVIAPNVSIETTDGADATMEFIAESVVWNFWPRMIDTRDGANQTMRFSLTDNATTVKIPDPRTHAQLRGFVDAMDQLRKEPSGTSEDELLIDCEISSMRPIKKLGRVVIQKGPVAPAVLPERPVPNGARITSAGTHHVALMRTPELIVTYLSGPSPVTGRLGYAGVFKCNQDVDEAFKAAEPPTHDDWIPRAVAERHWRTFVNVALDRIQGQCRIAAGINAAGATAGEFDAIPLGEFADALAALMPGQIGPGARRSSRAGAAQVRRGALGRRDIDTVTDQVWVDATPADKTTSEDVKLDEGTKRPIDTEESLTNPRPVVLATPPQTRSAGEPALRVAEDGVPVVSYPFELRTRGNRVQLSARVEVMTNDGGSVEEEPPRGYVPPRVHCWVGPDGSRIDESTVTVGPEDADGAWEIEIPLTDEMVRVDLSVAVV